MPTIHWPLSQNTQYAPRRRHTLQIAQENCVVGENERQNMQTNLANSEIDRLDENGPNCQVDYHCSSSGDCHGWSLIQKI